MVKVEWNTNIYRLYGNLYRIQLFEKYCVDDEWASRKDTWLFPLNTNKGIEILEDADQIRNKRDGYTMLMSKVVMEVPIELVDVYDLKRI